PGAAATVEFVNQLVKIAELIRGRRPEQLVDEFLGRDRRHAEILDLEPAGNIGQANCCRIVSPRRQRKAEDGEDHVARARDVVDLSRPRWEVLANSTA